MSVELSTHPDVVPALLTEKVKLVGWKCGDSGELLDGKEAVPFASVPCIRLDNTPESVDPTPAVAHLRADLCRCCNAVASGESSCDRKRPVATPRLLPHGRGKVMAASVLLR